MDTLFEDYIKSKGFLELFTIIGAFDSGRNGPRESPKEARIEAGL
jgi:hypothetical protein